MERQQAAAFFDLDRTIIGGSSVFVFGRVARRHGLMSLPDMARDAASAAAFHVLGASDDKAEAVRERILGAIAGVPRTVLLELGDDILPPLLARVRPEARTLVDLHRSAQRDTWVVSASPIEIVGEFANAMQMTGAIATVADVENGIYTGSLAEEFCYGTGKRRRIEKLASERGYDLRLCYAYSDSVSDLPMLELVGHPVAVNPDSSLRAIARQRGWPVVEFARTAKRVVKLTTAATAAGALAAGTYLLGRSHGRSV